MIGPENRRFGIDVRSKFDWNVNRYVLRSREIWYRPEEHGTNGVHEFDDRHILIMSGRVGIHVSIATRRIRYRQLEPIATRDDILYWNLPFDGSLETGAVD